MKTSIHPHSLRRIAFCAFAPLGLIITSSTLAATIVWGPATNVSSDTDVSTIGALVEAANTGIDQNSVPTTTSVNGVTFTGWGIAGGGTFTSPGGHFNMATAAGYFQQSVNAFGSGAPPFSGLSSAYQTLLRGGNYSQSQTNSNDFTGALILTLQGLTPGALYELQWWTNDSRPFATGPVTATGGSGSVSLDPNTSNAAGGTGQFARGTFTADGVTQTVTFTTSGNGNLQNAFQLRAVPEPGSMALLAMGMALFMGGRKTQRRRTMNNAVPDRLIPNDHRLLGR